MVAREDVCDYLQQELVIPQIPYRHQGRLHLHGKVDCLGVIIAVCRKFNLVNWDCNEYSEQAFGYKLIEYGDRVCNEAINLQPADVLLFKISVLPQHLGVYVGNGQLVHAGKGFGVKKVTFDQRWQQRVVKKYQLPNII